MEIICDWCGHKQELPDEGTEEPILCENCGEEIPT
ncbi:hypothetical protein ES708_16598 [subsurface metagenome]